MLHYHDIVLRLLPFVVYSWHAMNPAKSAARWMFYTNKVNMHSRNANCNHNLYRKARPKRKLYKM